MLAVKGSTVRSAGALEVLSLADGVESRSGVPGIRFHSTVLVAVLEITLAGGNISAKARAARGPELLDVHPDDDHVLAGGDWFPVDGNTLNEIREWLGIHHSFGLEAYLDLYRGLATPFDVVDRLDDADLVTLVAAGEPRIYELRADLYPYQRTGIQWLTAHADVGVGGILADEMGLGKTLQALGLLLHEVANSRRPSIVVMPLTLIENWRRELLKFAPTLRFYRHIGQERARSPGAIRDVDVVLTSYETVVSDVGLLSMVAWDLLITDEAQAFKNPETLRARTLAKLRRRAAFAMTGTPLENRALDLWSIGAIAEPGFLGTRHHFEEVLAASPELLRTAVRPIILRREIADVAKDLPDRIDIDVPLEMFGPESMEYGKLIESVGADESPPLALITRLRQFTAHPKLLGKLMAAPSLDASAKLSRFMEIVEEIRVSGQKVIVFAAYRAASDLLAAQITTRFGIPAWILDGRVPHGERQGLLDLFAGSQSSAALVMNPVVGGVGLNITAATHVIHYTLEWNPAKEDQATARAWRRGQELPVTVHRLFYVGTIDEAIVERMRHKRALFDQVIEPVEHESEGELKALLAAAMTRWKNG